MYSAFIPGYQSLDDLKTKENSKKRTNSKSNIDDEINNLEKHIRLIFPSQ